MKHLIAVLALAFLSSLAIPLNADEPVHLSVKQVLDLMKVVPEKAHQERAGRYDQVAEAKLIAAAIAKAAPEKDTASLMTVYTAYESSNQIHDKDGECLGGDLDATTGEYRSWGPFQLQDVPKTVACDPLLAAIHWLELKSHAEAICKDNPPDERLAPLTGGSCTNRGGRKVSRIRAAIARTVAASAP